MVWRVAAIAAAAFGLIFHVGDRICPFLGRGTVGRTGGRRKEGGREEDLDKANFGRFNTC